MLIVYRRLRLTLIYVLSVHPPELFMLLEMPQLWVALGFVYLLLKVNRLKHPSSRISWNS